jgi:translation initiation factor IF-2
VSSREQRHMPLHMGLSRAWSRWLKKPSSWQRVRVAGKRVAQVAASEPQPSWQRWTRQAVPRGAREAARREQAAPGADREQSRCARRGRPRRARRAARGATAPRAPAARQPRTGPGGREGRGGTAPRRGRQVTARTQGRGRGSHALRLGRRTAAGRKGSRVPRRGRAEASARRASAPGPTTRHGCELGRARRWGEPRPRGGGRTSQGGGRAPRRTPSRGTTRAPAELQATRHGRAGPSSKPRRGHREEEDGAEGTGKGRRGELTSGRGPSGWTRQQRFWVTRVMGRGERNVVGRGR